MTYTSWGLRPILFGILCLGFVSLGACSTFPSGGPPVTDSTFSAVLVDLHLTRARADHLETLQPGIRDSVFAHHGIQRSDFEATLRYHSRHPDSFKSLYNGVLDTLNAIEGELRGRGYSYDNRPDDRAN